MAGRPRRDVVVFYELIRHEFWWAVIFAAMRHGWPGGDDTLPNPETATKWRYIKSGRFWLNTRNRERLEYFHAAEWDSHAKEIDEDFMENVVRARPRDLPSEPEIWETFTAIGTTPSELRRAAKRSQFLTGPHLKVLLRYAKRLCDSKRELRYPRAGLRPQSKPRPSSEDKRAEYLARAMAGLTLRKPLAPSTAIDLLRKMKHGKGCACIECRLNLRLKL